MKTKSNTLRLMLATAALGVLASAIYAATDARYWMRAKPVTTFSEAKKVGPDDLVTMQCKSCKTIMIRDTRYIGPRGKGHDDWFTVGSTHACEECDGEITVVRGNPKDSMQYNCSKCGEGSVTCCVAVAAKK